jgi:4'-phosphopantetheinyl transferase
VVSCFSAAATAFAAFCSALALLAASFFNVSSAFFRAWTRKEAIIKAHGDGMSLPLSQFGVSIKLEEEVRLLHLDWSPQQCGEWQLASFTVAQEVPGAVAMRGVLGEVKFWDLP